MMTAMVQSKTMERIATWKRLKRFDIVNDIIQKDILLRNTIEK